MSKIKITFFHENDDWQNVVAFTSDDKEALEKLRILFDTEGEVWTTDAYPILMAPIFEKYKEAHFEGKYLFHRVMFDADKNNAVDGVSSEDVVNMFTQHNLALLHVESTNKYVQLIARAIVKNDSSIVDILSHDYTRSDVFLDETDLVPQEPC